MAVLSLRKTQVSKGVNGKLTILTKRLLDVEKQLSAGMALFTKMVMHLHHKNPGFWFLLKK